MQSPSRVAGVASVFGFAGLAAFALGPLGVQLGVWAPLVGFAIFALGLLLGLLAIVLGLIGVWRTRAATGLQGRGRALTGLALGLLAVLIVGFARGDADSRADFNDVTTNPNAPPSFAKAGDIEANQGRDMSYPAAFAPKQRELYPDLATLSLDAAPAEALRQAEAAGTALGWEITYTDPATGRLEATDTSSIFEFVDDVVVVVRPAGAGSQLDVRSKSRDGRGDLGVNAKRIRAFRDQLGAG